MLARPEFTKRIRTTTAQRAEMCIAIDSPNAYRNEKVWTLLVADLLAHAPNQQTLVDLLCSGGAPWPPVDVSAIGIRVTRDVSATG